MNILAIVHHWPPDVNSTGILMLKLFSQLHARGHHIRVISTFPHYEGFRVWPEFRRKLYRRTLEDGIVVYRVFSFTSGTKTMRHRLLNYISFNLAALVTGLAIRTRPDAIFCTNGSFFSGLTGYVISRLRRSRLVYNLQDLYPEVPVAQGQLRSTRAISVLARIERFMYARADHLSVIADPFSQNLQGKGVPSAKISVIPNFVDVSFIKPLPSDNEFSRSHRIADRFVVSHAGNLGYVYDLATMLEAAAILQRRRMSKIRFMVVGDGVARDELRALAESLKLRNVIWLPFQDHSVLPYLRAASSAQVALYKPGASAYSMPSKVYEIMASGRPLIASGDQGSALFELVSMTKCGVWVPPSDPDALASVIVDLFEHPAKATRLGKNGRRVAVRDYSLECVSKRYEELFAEVVRSGSART